MLLTTNKFTVATRTIKSNHLFLVDDHFGEITTGNESGLGFYNLDTRFLSCFEIHMNNTNPVCLLSSTESGYASTLVYTNTQINTVNAENHPCLVPEETIQLKRESIIDGALFERFTLISYNVEPVLIQITLQFDADFQDIFEIRHLVPPLNRHLAAPVWEDNALVFRYESPHKKMETRIVFKDFMPRQKDDRTIIYETLLHPLEQRQFNLEIQPNVHNGTTAHWLTKGDNFEDSLNRRQTFNQHWRDETTEFISDNEDFNDMLDRTQKDLRMLLTHSDDGKFFLAAGIPWYVCLFGRDSIITSWESLMFNPNLAKWTLQILAMYQGNRYDPERDEEPGKILHELRKGELADSKVIPHTPYYGSVDSTPLWIILLYEYFLWTRDMETIQDLWPHAIAAMEWIDRKIAESPLHYVTYKTQAPPGLGIVHQGWKDSNNSAMYDNGIQAEPPIALVEVQGYVYHAKRSMATLAELMNDKALKSRLRQEAADFKSRFNRDFWLDDRGFCALGLDSHGNHLRVISSNPGHCLESGILTSAHAKQLANRIMATDMYNGWGIRTLSGQMLSYNPMSYHNGSVWPHDNAMIAKGLSAIGRPDLSEKIFTGLFEAARLMDYRRLPELFCGFSRDPSKTDPPVRYPVACSPQAWAAGSVYCLMQSMLAVQPDPQGDSLKVHQPQLPPWINTLRVKNMRVGNAVLDLEFKRTDKTVMVDVQNRHGKIDILLKI